jgi:hypothetical protein
MSAFIQVFLLIGSLVSFTVYSGGMCNYRSNSLEVLLSFVRVFDLFFTADKIHYFEA